MEDNYIYTREEFLRDVHVSFCQGHISELEGSYLLGSWPVNIQAVHYSSAESPEAVVSEERCSFNPARDDAEDAALYSDLFCDEEAPSPLQQVVGERMRTYCFPGGHQISVGAVTGFMPTPLGEHCLETVYGEKFIVATGWLCIQLERDSWF